MDSQQKQKNLLHPRNRHRDPYDFKCLAESFPPLSQFVSKNQFGNISIDFADPYAVKALNQALLKFFYGISNWDIPAHSLCPPIPGRADYIHTLADLLASSNRGVIPRGGSIRVLDLGVGANCIYPLIGHQEYGWSFLGSDIDPIALANAQKIVDQNEGLSKTIELRIQSSPSQFFEGLDLTDGGFDLSMCNPPFHNSLEEAEEGSRRKWRNLGSSGSDKRNTPPVLNFGGQSTELCYPGGEKAFIRQMIKESRLNSKKCKWFTTLVSKESSLPSIYKVLEKANPFEVKTIPMAQGQKKSRIVAWTFTKEKA